MLTVGFVNKTAQYVKSQIAYAQYKIGQTWYKANISTAIRDNSRIAISFTMVNQTGAATDTVTEVQLFDFNDQKIAEKQESNQIRSGEGGAYYQFDITVAET